MTNDIDGIPTKELGNSGQLEKIVLEHMKMQLGVRMGGHALEKAEVHLIANELNRGVDAYFTTELLGETVGEYSKVVYFRCPKSWFQMFKRQHFPAWLKRAFPIQTKLREEIVIFTVKAVYPQLPMIKSDVGPIFYRHELEKAEPAG